jgi:hypothetical protein
MSGESAMDTALTGTSVLIVEDNWLIALSLVETCRDAGAEIVGPASTVAQAWLSTRPKLMASNRATV